jgi:hypothetical protein
MHIILGMRLPISFFFFFVLCWFVKQEQKQKETRKRWRAIQKNKGKRNENL